jgi:hypothetical protein
MGTLAAVGRLPANAAGIPETMTERLRCDGIESYAEYRADRAVSAAEWRSAHNEIRRYRRLIHAGK